MPAADTGRQGSVASLPGDQTAAAGGNATQTRIATTPNLRHKNSMQYRIRLIQSAEGWAVSCPSLPGCHSQGDTREAAVENIKAAIQEWLKVEPEESQAVKVEDNLAAL